MIKEVNVSLNVKSDNRYVNIWLSCIFGDTARVKHLYSRGEDFFIIAEYKITFDKGVTYNQLKDICTVYNITINSIKEKVA